MSWERARKPEHKEERRAAILAAAAELFDEGGVEGASLTSIARGAGISKANVYRYFESREAIFLELMVEEQDLWEQEILSGLADLEGRNDPAAVAALMARALVHRPRLCGMMASLASVLEHNVGVEAVAGFKRRFAAGVYEIIPALHGALPDISVPALKAFLMHHYLHATGAWPHGHPSPVVQEVLAMDEFAEMRMDFETEVRANAECLLRGLSGS